jgi:hypothetical protein
VPTFLQKTSHQITIGGIGRLKAPDRRNHTGFAPSLVTFDFEAGKHSGIHLEVLTIIGTKKHGIKQTSANDLTTAGTYRSGNFYAGEKIFSV